MGQKESDQHNKEKKGVETMKQTLLALGLVMLLVLSGCGQDYVHEKHTEGDNYVFCESLGYTGWVYASNDFFAVDFRCTNLSDEVVSNLNNKTLQIPESVKRNYKGVLE